MNKFGIFILSLILIVLLAPVSDAGPQDKWVQCTSPPPSSAENFVCCKIAGQFEWKDKCPVIFSQTGIPAGTTWSVTVSGIPFTSTSSSITVQVDFSISNSVDYSYGSPVQGLSGIRYVCTSRCSGTVNSISESVSATYQTQFQLTMSVEPAGAGVTKPSTGTYWDTGSDVPISATPISGFEFLSWSGLGTGSYTGTSSTANIKMNSPIQQTANFVVSAGAHCSIISSHTSGDERDTGAHRHFFLSESNKWGTEDCTTKLTRDTDGGDAPLEGGIVTDFTICSQGSCTSQIFSDTCSGNTLTEFFNSGSSFLSKQYDCSTFGIGWTCSAGKCVPSIFDFSLSVNPAAATIAQGGSVESTVTATLITGSQSVSFSCVNLPAGASCNFFPSSCNPTCSSIVTILTSANTPAGRFPITIRGSGGSLIRDVTYALTVVPACVFSLSMKDLQKTNVFKCPSVPCENKWNVILQDTSTNCGDLIEYTIPSVTLDPTCHQDTGIYTFKSTSPNAKKSFPLTLFVENNKDLNAFTVFVKTKGADSCIVSFDFEDITGKVMDPSFAAIPPSIANQPPFVSIFEFSGEVSIFTAAWETFYPDNDPEREMNVKCGLNCDPELENCGEVTGKGCLPYDAPQGLGGTKKGSCGVPSPAYDFTTTNKITCLFYDPVDPSLKTRENRDFIPIDFQIASTSKIITTVGKKAELKVDVVNTGILPDSYTITLAADRPEAVDISPSITTTGGISLNQIISLFFSVLPVIDTDNRITVTVASNTNPSTFKTLTIDIDTGFYALPEFGLIGFLQIVAIAAIVYFLLVNRIGAKKRKRR